MEIVKLEMWKFLDLAQQGKIGKPDMYNYIKYNSAGDIQYLTLLEQEVGDLIRVQDTLFKQSERSEQEIAFYEKLNKGEDIKDIPHTIHLSFEETKKLIDNTPNWEELTYAERIKLRNDKAIEINSDLITPIIKYSENWGTYTLKELRHLIRQEIETTDKDNEGTDKLSGTAISIQTLAIECLLSELKIATDLPRTAIAGFMQFITGRQTTSKPSDTSFYKLIGKSPDTKGETEEYNKRCEVVAKEFDSIGLSVLAQRIRNGKGEKD